MFFYYIVALQMRWHTNHDECAVESNNRLNVFNHFTRQIWLSEYKILNVEVNKIRIVNKRRHWFMEVMQSVPDLQRALLHLHRNIFNYVHILLK